MLILGNEVENWRFESNNKLIQEKGSADKASKHLSRKLKDLSGRLSKKIKLNENWT